MSNIKTNNFLSEAEYKAMLDEIREQKRSAKKEMKRGCYNMAGMYYGDAAALCRVLGHINDGDFKRAAETAQGQDTAARDNVPSAIWDKLSKYM